VTVYQFKWLTPHSRSDKTNTVQHLVSANMATTTQMFHLSIHRISHNFKLHISLNSIVSVYMFVPRYLLLNSTFEQWNNWRQLTNQNWNTGKYNVNLCHSSLDWSTYIIKVKVVIIVPSF